MPRRLILALVVAALAAPALAKEAPAGEEPVGRYVDINTVGLPIVWQGRLVNYVFAAVRVNLTAKADAAALRAKEPFFRDALVRAAHRTPFTVAGDLTRIDEAALKRTMTAEARRIAGAGAVAGVEVRNQTPQKRRGLLRP